MRPRWSAARRQPRKLVLQGRADKKGRADREATPKKEMRDVGYVSASSTGDLIFDVLDPRPPPCLTVED